MWKESVSDQGFSEVDPTVKVQVKSYYLANLKKMDRGRPWCPPLDSPMGMVVLVNTHLRGLQLRSAHVTQYTECTTIRAKATNKRHVQST